MWESFKALCTAMIKLWWVIVIGIVFSGIGAILIVWPGIKFPIWILVAAPFVGLLIAGYLAFHKVYFSLMTYDNIEQILTHLGEFRNKGVELRNRGLNLKTLPEVESWVREVEHWHTISENEVKRLSSSEASVFTTADLIKNAIEFAAVNANHREYVQILSMWTNNLKELIVRYSTQNLSRKLLKD
jgi:hypothetical protein